MTAVEDFTPAYVVDSFDPDELDQYTGPSPSHSAPALGQCLICGYMAYRKHFGVICCRACAAFFRRTVAQKRQYTCLHNDECDVRSGNSRNACKFCRFQRCIRAGMNMAAVVERNNDEFRSFAADSPIRRILISQRSTFVNRYREHLRAYNGNHSLVRMGRENPVLANMVTVASEFPVLMQYLYGTGFEEHGLKKPEIIDLAKEIFYSWISYHSITATLRNSGHKTNLSYFIDESFVRASDEEVAIFVTTCPGLFDYNLAARATLKCCAENIECASRLHKVRMEEYEHSIMFHIHALNVADKMFPGNPNFRPALNDVLSRLKDHYVCNYDDVALRMGNMILMISQLSHWARVLTEYVTVLHLNGYNSILNKLREDPIPAAVTETHSK